MILVFAAAVVALLILIFIWRLARDSRQRYEILKRGVDIYKNDGVR